MPDTFALGSYAFNRQSRAQIAYNFARRAYDAADEACQCEGRCKCEPVKVAWKAYQDAGAELAEARASYTEFRACYRSAA